MAAEFVEGDRITMPWTEVQGVEMGAGSGTVCGHRLDERGTGSDGMEGQDGCDDKVEKTEDGGLKCQSHRMTIDPPTASRLKTQHDVWAFTCVHGPCVCIRGIRRYAEKQQRNK